MKKINNMLEQDNMIIKNIERELGHEKQNLNHNCDLRDKDYDGMILDTKLMKTMGVIFTISIFLLPLLDFNIIYSIVEIIRNTAFLSGIVFIFDYTIDKILFEKHNKQALENAKIVAILSKKLEQERQNSLKISNVSRIEKLSELKKFVELAREYSKNYKQYQALFHNDIENKYFVSESEESMIMQEFIMDDIKRQKELEKELIEDDIKVLSKVKK